MDDSVYSLTRRVAAQMSQVRSPAQTPLMAHPCALQAAGFSSSEASALRLLSDALAEYAQLLAATATESAHHCAACGPLLALVSSFPSLPLQSTGWR